MVSTGMWTRGESCSFNASVETVGSNVSLKAGQWGGLISISMLKGELCTLMGFLETLQSSIEQGLRQRKNSGTKGLEKEKSGGGRRCRK